QGAGAGARHTLADAAYPRFKRLRIDEPDYRHRRLLRAHRERPCRRAAEERDEVAASHSMTSSARASNGLHYSALRPPKLTTLAHFSVSSATTFANSP